jgi:signal peptidase I
MPSAIAEIARALSWLALPVGVVCIIDDWLLRPKRRLAAAAAAVDPPLVSAAYRLLPVLIGVVVLRLFLTEELDFSVLLVVIAAITGFIWAADAALLARGRKLEVEASGKDPTLVPEPLTVDYARSFFPVAFAVLALRAFVFEPFRIPSDSMMPTLLDGDFIVVRKFAYGLKLPVTNTKILNTGEPKRGDVVVFHPPIQPSEVWIKRVAAVPGDHVTVRDDRITINGTPVPLPGCNRSDARGYVCNGNAPAGAIPLIERRVFEMVVPSGEYLMMGDNRDNSDDGRFWGFVTDQELIGKATRIWFNWSPARRGGPIWSRIGMKIR